MAENTSGKTKYEIQSSHVIDGIRYYAPLTRERLKKIKNLVLEDSDTIVCGFPKSGNVWMTVIVRAIMSHDNLDMFENTKLGINEGMLDGNLPVAETLPHPACFWSHLYFQLLPSYVNKEKNGKVIYMLRNPKDVAVSYFHFHKMFTLMGPWQGELNVFFKAFLKGDVFFGSWFDHVKSFWYNRENTNMLLVRYEDLLNDPLFWIRKVAEFINRPVDDETLERIVSITDFNNMKKNSNLNLDGHPLFLPGSVFLRKGIVGDWKNVFSEDQNQEINTLMDQFGKETGIYFDYS